MSREARLLMEEVDMISIQSKTDTSSLMILSSVVFFVSFFFGFIFYPAKYEILSGFSQLGLSMVNDTSNSISKIIFVMFCITESLIFLTLFASAFKVEKALSIFAMMTTIGYFMMSFPADLYHIFHALGLDIVRLTQTICIIYIVIKYKYKEAYIFMAALIVLYGFAIVGLFYNNISWLAIINNIYFIIMYLLIFISFSIPSNRK